VVADPHHAATGIGLNEYQGKKTSFLILKHAMSNIILTGSKYNADINRNCARRQFKGCCHCCVVVVFRNAKLGRLANSSRNGKFVIVHNMKTRRGSRGIPPLILNLGGKWR
jgi:hypothetical protein